jgi:predicted CopG family antitoxin
MDEVNIRHTITIDDKTYQRLKSKGNFGETYSEVVGHVLDQLDTVNGGSEK